MIPDLGRKIALAARAERSIVEFCGPWPMANWIKPGAGHLIIFSLFQLCYYSTMNEIDVLKTVCKRLSDSKIAYMISGSVALSFYSEPRMTRDIDIVININARDIDKMMKLFENDFYIDREMLETAVQNQTMFNIINLEALIKIDFIIRKNEIYRIEEFKNRIKIKLHDAEIYMVAIEDLIVSKLYWAKDSYSEIQLRDIKKLLKADFDLEYVKKWCKHLGLENVLGKALNE
jgi:hypothetical protein